VVVFGDGLELLLHSAAPAPRATATPPALLAFDRSVPFPAQRHTRHTRRTRRAPNANASPNATHKNRARGRLGLARSPTPIHPRGKVDARRVERRRSAMGESNELPLCPICCDTLGKYGGPATLPCGERHAQGRRGSSERAPPATSPRFRPREGPPPFELRHRHHNIALGSDAVLARPLRRGGGAARRGMRAAMQAPAPRPSPPPNAAPTPPAGHNGCLNCLQHVQSRNPLCPLCRTPFDPSAELTCNHELRGLIDLATSMCGLRPGGTWPSPS
jgi:hypothetical protein